MKVDFKYTDFDAYIKLRAKYDSMNALQYDEDTADLNVEFELDEIREELKLYELNLSKLNQTMSSRNWFRLFKKLNIHRRSEKNAEDNSDLILDSIEVRAILDFV